MQSICALKANRGRLSVKSTIRAILPVRKSPRLSYSMNIADYIDNYISLFLLVRMGVIIIYT